MENRAKIVSLILFIITLWVLPFLYFKAKLQADKELEAFSVCANNLPSNIDNYDGLKLYLNACETLSREI